MGFYFLIQASIYATERYDNEIRTITISNALACSLLSKINVSLSVFQVVVLAAPEFPIMITERR